MANDLEGLRCAVIKTHLPRCQPRAVRQTRPYACRWLGGRCGPGRPRHGLLPPPRGPAASEAEDGLVRIASILGALSECRHLRILEVLWDNELCVSELTDILRLHQYEASRILIFLRRAGLLDDRREGRWIYYSVSRTAKKDPFARRLLKLIHRRILDLGEMTDDCRRLEQCLSKRSRKCGVEALEA